MKVAWFFLSFVPVPFLFHFYEYGQHSQRKEAPFLMIGFLLAIILAGVAATQVKIILVFLINLITMIFSLFLAASFIPNDPYWFTVVGRNGAVVFIAIIYLIGQLLVRWIVRVAGRNHV
ncbi:hypothetical protein EDD69_101302 [Thermolongibacillus altinsuensis]|uniref:Uncharacterized protein n=3 Tax=Thermolongibacillus altinsuensis TaxID=575256 RepID=A0A4R1QR65_9BACL|nr:hypothetical protein EDD69_101302 [Thermolongibacillus altinsuensis]